MITTPWIEHFVSGIVDTHPYCMRCKKQLPTSGRGLFGRLWVKDEMFLLIEPNKFNQCE